MKIMSLSTFYGPLFWLIDQTKHKINHIRFWIFSGTLSYWHTIFKIPYQSEWHVFKILTNFVNSSQLKVNQISLKNQKGLFTKSDNWKAVSNLFWPSFSKNFSYKIIIFEIFLISFAYNRSWNFGKGVFCTKI